MYNNYVQYLESNSVNIESDNFKSNPHYNGILEHVSYDLGLQYLTLIETEFPDITYENLIGFINMNDKYGCPNKNMFLFQFTHIIECSPTTLRYVYHALTILNHFKETCCENMVEVGCGYGGLCLSIQYFSRLQNITIKNYHLVDLPVVCNLIQNYLQIHSSNLYSTIRVHSSETYGKNITDTKLFFISNYCFTEVEEHHNKQYCDFLLPLTQHGFITWQNGGNGGSYPIENSSSIIKKTIKNIIEEKPQTDAGYDIYKNYFVIF
jgi:hypothetical protein